MFIINISQKKINPPGPPHLPRRQAGKGEGIREGKQMHGNNGSIGKDWAQK